MSFSLYGALPPSKSKKEQNTNEKVQAPSSKSISISSLYASIPAPGAPLTAPKKPETESKPVETTSTPTASATATNSTTTQNKPAGWAAFNTFRPVMRKPTIQAKPKLNRPVIPAGATVVSTKVVSKAEKSEEEETTNESKQPTSNIDLGAIPLLTSAEDVNGFRAVQKPKKKGKKGKNNNNNPQPIVFNMLEDYDPHKPNDYEQYKEERKELREQQRKKREWEKRRQSRSRSPSRSLSRSRSRSRSRSPYYSDYSRSPTPEDDRYYQSPNHQAPQVKININESADDAYMRRAMLSQQQQPQLQQQRPEESIAQNPAQGIARKVLAKYGWQEGQGLGRGEDGIKEALQVQATGGGGGVIVNNRAERNELNTSQVILLTNMVGPGEVDDMLQEETAEECGKYGKVERCLIFEVPNGKISDDRAVRIFVKFSELESARSAIADLDGRYFGGRVVSATSFDSGRFDRLDLAPRPEEFL